ncbi:unnamed protein product [Echinostoma caproni]|uniref:PDZ domain-containing protein n=1 Tax=Echinostoma caproni TaxID=27848 RepID=A0A183B4B3_9TREM|nr:unnamed protein product [Echinostoma caproni]
MLMNLLGLAVKIHLLTSSTQISQSTVSSVNIYFVQQPIRKWFYTLPCDAGSLKIRLVRILASVSRLSGTSNGCRCGLIIIKKSTKPGTYTIYNILSPFGFGFIISCRISPYTHSTLEYNRRNDEIDPLAASAEYELEKHLEEMEFVNVDLKKGPQGLGISILGLGVDNVGGHQKLGIFIKALTPGGAAEADGSSAFLIAVTTSSLMSVYQLIAIVTFY